MEYAHDESFPPPSLMAGNHYSLRELTPVTVSFLSKEVCFRSNQTDLFLARASQYRRAWWFCGIVTTSAPWQPSHFFQPAMALWWGSTTKFFRILSYGGQFRASEHQLLATTPDCAHIWRSAPAPNSQNQFDPRLCIKCRLSRSKCYSQRSRNEIPWSQWVKPWRVHTPKM